MKIFDVTVPIKEGMVSYPGDPVFRRRVVSSFEKGDSFESAVLEMGSHTGTHIDVSAHMVKGSKRLDDVPLQTFIGPARVFDMQSVSGLIQAADLKNLQWKNVERVLFKTKNSAKWSSAKSVDKGAVALSGDAAKFLVEKKIKLVGIDGLSIDKFGEKAHPAHIQLLRAGIIIIEGLDLSAVSPGDYDLICAPLKVAGGDGAPVRVFLTQST